MRSFLVLSASFASLASAHQNFHQFWVNGVTPGYQTCIRMPPNNNPVTNVQSNDITCNVNGNVVPSTVSTCDAKAGDSIKVQWDQSTHPSPITHFLYGPVADAKSATGIGKWYKIDEFDTQGAKWANEIMETQNMTYTFKLPANLATGDYLLRSEMLALHASQTLDGAQFYIGCAQLHITGPGGTCSPGITLPGAYKDTDTDIYIPNFYNGFDLSTYVAPGGPVATCGSGGSSPAPTTTSKAPVPTTTTTTKAPVTTSKATTTVGTTKTTTVATTFQTTTSAAPVGGTVPKYGQCGGTGYTGPTVCASGSTCTASNQYYSQCV